MAIYLYSQIPNWQSINLQFTGFLRLSLFPIRIYLTEATSSISSGSTPSTGKNKLHFYMICQLIAVYTVHIHKLVSMMLGRKIATQYSRGTSKTLCMFQYWSLYILKDLPSTWRLRMNNLQLMWPYNNLCGFRLSYPLSPNDWPHLWYMESGHSICQICTSFIISWCQTLS